MGIFILNFLRKGEYLFLIEAKAYMNHHFSVGGHVGRFQFGANMNGLLLTF